MWAFFAEIVAKILTAIGVYEAGQSKARDADTIAVQKTVITDQQKSGAIYDALEHTDDSHLADVARAAGVSRNPPK